MGLNQAPVNGGSDCARGSHRSFHLIADAHEWTHENLTVSVHHPAKPRPRERERGREGERERGRQGASDRGGERESEGRREGGSFGDLGVPPVILRTPLHCDELCLQSCPL